MDHLFSLFHPTSLAIIGISRKSPSLGHLILDNLEDADYSGDIYLVNPKAKKIASRSVYNDISELPPVDLAITLTPPKYVPQTLRQLDGKCNVVTIITAGFGDELTEELLSIATNTGIRVLGPNSMGSYSHGVSASFSPLPISPGSLGYISQSGSIIAVVQEQMVGGFGFSSFISLGNKIDITEIDVFPYLANDSTTSVIAGYLESFSHPKKLKDVLGTITPQKPVILVKGGRTAEGSQAVTSHTGALAGNYRLTRSLLHSCGVILVQTIEKQINLARFVAKFGSRKHTGVVTISSAGGPGVLAADEIIETGLPLAQLEPKTVDELRDVIPAFGNASNPLDLVADAGINRYIDTVNIIRKDPNVSTILVIIVHPVLIDPKPLLDALDALNLPIICAYLGLDYASFDHYDNLIIYQTTKDIIEILLSINEYEEWKSNHINLQDHSHLDVLTTKQINTSDSREKILCAYNFSYPDTFHTSSFDDALQWFSLQDGPVVLKLSHPAFSHKSDSGGVILNITKSDGFETGWQQLQTIYDDHGIPKLDRIIELQPYYTGGIEVALGIVRDEQFGHFLLLGSGGTMVELLDDTVFLPSPTSRLAVKNALQGLRLNTLLQGFRGSKEVEIDLIVDHVLWLDKLIHDHPEITELDINPLYVIPETGECVVLDARIALS